MSKYNVAKLGTNKNGRGKGSTTVERPCGNCKKVLFVTQYYITKRGYKKSYCGKKCESEARSFKTIDESIKKAKRYKDKNGYVYITCMSKHYLLHRVLMEKKIGRKLHKNEQVHHMNGNPSDNRLDNLAIVDHKSHRSEASKKVKVLQERIRKLENVHST